MPPADGPDSALPVAGPDSTLPVVADPNATLSASGPSSTHPAARTNSTLPVGGRILVVLRGEAMRTPHTKSWREVSGQLGCDKAGYDRQVAASKSLMANIVKPLESIRNRVDLLVTNYPCKEGQLIESIYSIYAAHRQTSIEPFQKRARNQAENMKWVLQRAVRRASLQGPYDLIIITRHDVIWRRRIDEWPALDVRKFNYASPCEARTCHAPFPDGMCECGNDLIHTMPGHMLDTFVKMPLWRHTKILNASRAYRQVGVDVGYALTDDPEEIGEGVRAPNQYYEVYCSLDDGDGD